MRANATAGSQASGNGLTSTISLRPAGPMERMFAESNAVRTAFVPERIRITGNPLDMAIQSNGFFEVKTADGVRSTRNGIFSLDNQRRIPPATIQINSEGSIQVDGNPVGTIKVVEFPESHAAEISRRLFIGAKPAVALKPQVQWDTSKSRL